MQLHTQSLTTHFVPPLNLSNLSNLSNRRQQTNLRKRIPFNRLSVKCSVSTASEPSTTNLAVANDKPSPAEISRTVMELSSVGTLSTLSDDGWPHAIGVRLAVDPDGSPILCLNRNFSGDKRSALHVQLEQCGLRTPQCTIQGSIDKPEDKKILKQLHSIWKKKFGEEVDEDSLYTVSVNRVLQIEDLMEEGIWVGESEYRTATPDPLRDVAANIINEINENNVEDIIRFCNVYVDSDFQVSEAKMIWMDRLGFDIRLWTPHRGVFDARIPFPREVTDEKGAKSSFNGMSQLAWEVEKSYIAPGFDKVKRLKPVGNRIHNS